MGKNKWQGWYEKDGQRLRIHSRPGIGDVVITVGDRCVRAERRGEWNSPPETEKAPKGLIQCRVPEGTRTQHRPPSSSARDFQPLALLLLVRLPSPVPASNPAHREDEGHRKQYHHRGPYTQDLIAQRVYQDAGDQRYPHRGDMVNTHPSR